MLADRSARSGFIQKQIRLPTPSLFLSKKWISAHSLQMPCLYLSRPTRRRSATQFLPDQIRLHHAQRSVMKLLLAFCMTAPFQLKIHEIIDFFCRQYLFFTFFLGTMAESGFLLVAVFTPTAALLGLHPTVPGLALA
jgi:hypothetical protein